MKKPLRPLKINKAVNADALWCLHFLHKAREVVFREGVVYLKAKKWADTAFLKNKLLSGNMIIKCHKIWYFVQLAQANFGFYVEIV